MRTIIAEIIIDEKHICQRREFIADDGVVDLAPTYKRLMAVAGAYGLKYVDVNFGVVRS